MKNVFIVISLVCLFCFTFGCQKGEEVAEEPAVDIAETLRTLREADRSWSQSAPDLEAFMSFIADDVVWYFCNRPTLTGKNEVRSFYEEVFAIPRFSLTWTPDRIEVSNAGDMGYAYGLYKVSYQDSSGNTVEETSNYATFWRKHNGGDWKVVLEADY